MGKATRWFRSLLGMKDKENVNSLNPGDRKDKRRWSFAKPLKESRVEAVFPPKDVVWLRSYMSETKKELNKHAVVAATAIAAAQATVAVVRLTNHCRTIPYGGGREILAAVKIQTLFRSYLARKALRALKGLVKLQAFVRGFLVRKRATATLHSMQALIRVQAAVRSERARRSFTKDRQSGLEFRHRKSIGKFDNERPEFHSQRLSTYESNINCYEESPKIVEIDTYRPYSRSRRINTCTSDSREESHSQSHYNSKPSPLPCKTPGCISIPEFHNLQDFELGFFADEYKYSNMAQSTPHFMNSKRSNGPATLAKSACGDSFFRLYSNYPSYMANTQSFNAKLRSHSAPKQRPKPGLKRDCSLMI